ncbi:acyl carrier protein [Pseudovibrio sp. POLY-S9]|uniref:acyl carrier protein n=1 Tax=Pseudovibrio sp. POLY-S9 TaxID=1576596 RepID=UPI00070C2A47|nr:acyl carrier protein [Pseudovibrio sp. POLY-S9]
MTIFELVKKAVLEVTDIDHTEITPSKKIEEIGITSLDFVYIQVTLMSELGIDVDLGNFTLNELSTIEDFIGFIEENS